MSTRFELQRERGWLEEILASGPREGLPLAGGKLCQGCGRLGFFEGAEEHSAAHWESGGDFLAFDPGHEPCSRVPRSSLVRNRRWRRCEVCRTPVEASPGTRCGHCWLCFACEARITEAERPPGAVLADLAFRRQELRGLLAPGPPVEPDEGLSLNRPRARQVPPLPGVLPLGLEPCGGCGQIRGMAPRPIRGEIEAVKSTCLCEGLVCRSCGRRRVRRPISDYFSAADGHWWHVPYFVGMLPLCPRCNQARNDELGRR